MSNEMKEGCAECAHDNKCWVDDHCILGWMPCLERCNVYKSKTSREKIDYILSLGDHIKALCWKQPFASLMLPPYCKVETRTRPINYRGLVLIVATAKPYTSPELVKMSGGEQALNIELRIAGHDGYMNSCVIGIGLLTDCREIKPDDKTYLKPENHTGRYAWVFDHVHAIQPIPMKGFQGWRNVDDELRSKIVLI